MFLFYFHLFIICLFEICTSCGCPSGKVAGHGCFGASLMLDPEVCYSINALVINCAAFGSFEYQGRMTLIEE
jgi:hypothetical protein